MGHVSGDQGMNIGWEEKDSSTNPTQPTRRQLPRQQETEEVKCPRCDSTNTKFCYYNNYNKSQPRHFCKSCKRHWTKGGTLRSVPVGGGRKNKRPRITNSASAAAAIPIMCPTFNNTLYTNKNTEFAKVGPTKDSHLTNQNTEFRIGDDKKDVTSMIYEALIDPSLSPLVLEPVPVIGSDNGEKNETGEFMFSSLGNNFDVSSLIPSSCGYDQFGGNFDSMEESTVTSVNVPGTSSGPWLGTDTGYWDWNEIDVLTSADHLNIVWDDDDAEIKP